MAAALAPSRLVGADERAAWLNPGGRYEEPDFLVRERLGDVRPALERRREVVARIGGYEPEWNSAARQDLRHGLNGLIDEIDIQ